MVRDTPEEVAVALLPGAEGRMPEGYVSGKRTGTRRWDFQERPWKLDPFRWHTNRLLCLLEPEKFYSSMLFWRAEDSEFLCYYINFQLPFLRGRRSVDSLDLELDLIISPDLKIEWKDLDDYQTALARGAISTEWEREIEAARDGILSRLENRAYPLDGSWLDWRPDAAWAPPALPENWDQV
jgi:protein associated with RNAse G/E